MTRIRSQNFLERLILAIHERLGIFWVSMGWPEPDQSLYARHYREIMSERQLAGIIHDELQRSLSSLVMCDLPDSILNPARAAVEKYRGHVFQAYFCPQEEVRLRQVAYGALGKAGEFLSARNEAGRPARVSSRSLG